MPIPGRYLIVILMVAGSFLTAGSAAAESSFILKRNTHTHFAGAHTVNKGMKDIDREYAYRINRAKANLAKAGSPEEKRYWELDYYENSALRIRYWIRKITGAISRIESRLREIGNASPPARAGEQRYDELKGLGTLLSKAEQPSPSRTADQTILAMTYTNVMQLVNRAGHARREEELKRSLHVLRQELAFFVEQYENLRSEFNRRYEEGRIS